MAEKTIIIIGAGMAGLSSGIYGRMNGYRTHIFEHHTKPGGVCTAWKRKDYTIDGCIHWLGGFKREPVFREVGALENNPFRPMKHFCRFMDDKTRQTLDVTSDLDRLASDMKSMEPGNPQVIDEMVSAARRLQTLDENVDRLGGLTGPRDALECLARYSMSVWEFCKNFSNPFLRWCLRNSFLPTMPAASLFMLFGQLEAGDLAFVEGGSLNFALRIARRYEELGGEVTYGATVEQILVKDDQAVGVQLTDGSEYRGEIVVSAADGYSTIFNMLGGRYVNQTIKDQYASWPLSPRIAIVSFGVAQVFPDEPFSLAVRLEQPVSVSGHHLDGFRMRIFNYDQTLAPPGKTVVQVTLGTDFDWWYRLHEGDRPRYDEEKERVAAAVLERLETYFPGITSQVEVADVATPYTWLHYTRNYQGSSMAWLTTPETTRAPIEKTLPGLDNFYMAGQWVGEGGIKGALYSGRNLVKTLCGQDGKRFLTSLP